MNCECALARKYLSYLKPKPRCCTNGNFEGMQCLSGFCYCVNEFGVQEGIEVEQSQSNTLNCSDFLVIHRNHSFGFSFAETNWVSVSTETRFEFRSTETLTETHILVIFLSFLKNSEIFFTTLNTILLKNYWKNIKKSLVICCYTMFKTTIWQNMGFGQGFGSGFSFGETFGFRFRFRPKPKKWFRWSSAPFVLNCNVHRIRMGFPGFPTA